MRLVTERLVLRDFEEQDWRAVLAYQSDLHYLRYYAWSVRDEPAVRDFVARQGTSRAVSSSLRSCYRQRTRDSLTTAGCECMTGSSGRETSATSWTRRTGNAATPQGGRAMLAFDFERLGLHRIWAECVADNTAAAHVLEKLGLRREGHFREHVYLKGAGGTASCMRLWIVSGENTPKAPIARTPLNHLIGADDPGWSPLEQSEARSRL